MVHENLKKHQFKPGQSGNVKGRPKGSSSKFKGTLSQLRQLDDLDLTRQFLRAVVTSDIKILEKLGITDAPTVAAKITAAKELNRVNAEISEKDAEAKAQQAEAHVKNVAPVSPQFSRVASINAGTK